MGKYEEEYTDEKLCKMWGITEKEWEYIDSRIHNYEGQAIKESNSNEE